jgi:hypothetical protein
VLRIGATACTRHRSRTLCVAVEGVVGKRNVRQSMVIKALHARPWSSDLGPGL